MVRYTPMRIYLSREIVCKLWYNLQARYFSDSKAIHHKRHSKTTTDSITRMTNARKVASSCLTVCELTTKIHYTVRDFCTDAINLAQISSKTIQKSRTFSIFITPSSFSHKACSIFYHPSSLKFFTSLQKIAKNCKNSTFKVEKKTR